MTIHDLANAAVTRRSVVGAIGAIGAGVGVVGSAGGTQEAEYAVEQDDACQSIRPLSYQDFSVQEFYGYTLDAEEGTPWSANLPVNLAKSDVSQLFLYEGPEGLSLVVLHDARERVAIDSGGAASFTFRGLPTDVAESEDSGWVVKDDPSNRSREVWDDRTDDEWTVHWSWKSNYTDGGTFRGLDSEFEIEIDPAWGEDAELEPFEPGGIESWEAVSGDPEDPDRYDLDMDSPVTVRTGSCDSENSLFP